MSQDDDHTYVTDEARHHLSLAYAHESKDELAAALRECETALQLAPDWAEAHNLHGVILDALEHDEEAVAAYQEAVRLDQRFEEAQANLQELVSEQEQIVGAADKSPSDVEGKGFATRVAAYVVDTIVLFGANQVAGFAGGLFLGIILLFSGRQFLIDEGENTIVFCLSGIVLSILYFTIFEGLYGASLGKILFGMRVVQTDGSHCTLGSAFTRGIFRLIDGFLFGAVAYSYMNRDRLQQRVGDREANTIVVGRKDPVIREHRDWGWFVVAAVAYLVLATIISLLVTVPALR